MTKPQPILSNMPWNIAQRIVNFTDKYSRISLRKSTRKLRQIVDNTAVEYDRIILKVEDEMVELQLDEGKLIEYHAHPRGCIIRDGNKRRWIEGGNHIMMAVADLATLLKNPKLSVNYLKFEMEKWNSFYPLKSQTLDQASLIDNVLRALGTFQHKQLTVESLCFSVPIKASSLISLLSHFKAEALVELYFDRGLQCSKEEMNVLAECEQWKKAKLLRITGKRVSVDKMDNFSHLILSETRVSVEEFQILVQRCLQLGDRFQSLLLDCKQGFDALLRHSSQTFHRFQSGTEFTLSTPNSEHSLRLIMTKPRILIRRL